MGNCGTCVYWGGSRCFDSGHDNPHYYHNDRMSANDSCHHWEKSYKAIMAEEYEREERARKEREERKERERKEEERKAREIIERYGKAAEQGDAEAQYKIGILYANGQGVSRDSMKANEILRKAAAQGHKEAKDYLVKAETEAVERKTREGKEAAEKKARENKEKIRKIRAFVGLLLQFSIMIAFFYTLSSSIKSNEFNSSTLIISPTIIIGGGSYLAFWIISLIFRRKVEPAFPWGIVFHLLMIAAFSIAVGTTAFSDDASTTVSIILVIITVIPGSIIFFSGYWVWGIIYTAIATPVGMAVTGGNNGTMLFFLIFVVPAIPGFIIMTKTEEW